MKRFAGLVRWCALVALAAGCGQKNPLLQPNQPPEVELFAQRAGASGYRLQWVGHDPDGTIDHYLYALGSPGMDLRTAAWTSTTEREHLLGTSPRRAEPGRAAIAATEPSVFTVRAVDTRGAQSTPAQIAFFDSTLLAPRVHVVVPPANPLVRYSLPSTTCFGWEGVAYKPDGSETRVSEYKYTLLTDETPVTIFTARQNPDSVRRYYAPRNWAGWDSTKGNVNNVVLENLTRDKEYIFVITCFDDQGNYDPIFSFHTNMIYFRVVYAAAALPRIGAFNSTFIYEQDQGTLDPSRVVNLEVPAGQRIEFNWYALPASDRNGNPLNGPIRGYRWALDLADVDDARHGDPGGHSGHWTPWDVTHTSTAVGPFGGGETHTLYIEANADQCGADSLVSLLSLRLHASQPSFDKDLLIVDDTRYLLDRINPFTSSCSDPQNRPIGNWPTQAELDTFLYAVGGKPWKCYPTGTLSTPGVFLGYSFDTLGTNLRVADLTVPLATLGHYRHVLWLTDAQAAHNARPGTDTGDIGGPQTALRYMNDNRRENTLAAYVQQGGQVWLAGAGAATASMINFNRSINDNTLPIPRTLTFRNADNELIPGRFMYDQAHWRSEFKQFRVQGGRIRRYLGRLETSPGVYSTLPDEIHLKTAATDPPPPNRVPVGSTFYQIQFDAEFLSMPNEILEDQDPRRPHEDFQSTLDTLYKVTAASLQPDTGPDAVQSVVMTYYHGADNAPLVMTGFNLWNFRRADLVQLVDFVLQQLWGLSRSAPVAGPAEIGGVDARRPFGKAARPGAVTVPVAASGAARRE